MPLSVKKVLFTSHTANFSKFNLLLMRWFKKQGYEVHYASAGEEEVLDCDKHFMVSFERSPYKKNNLKALVQLKKIIESENYDIIHTHTPMGSIITRLAAINARKKGTRVIYTAHGFHFFKGANIINWLIYYPIEKFVASFTDVLITINSEDYKIAKLKFKTEVIFVPGVGIDQDKFNFKMDDNQKRILKRSLGLKKDDFVMIYTADLSKRKNQIWLINSLSNLILNNPKIHLLLPGKDDLNGKCQQIVAELGVNNNVHFLGYRNDVPRLLKIADIALSSSTQEGLPVNIMESMYSGLPIIVTNCRGNRDLVDDGVNGYLIDNYNSDELCTRINNLITNPNDRKQFGLQGRLKIIENNLSDKVIGDMAKIYEKRVTIIHLLCSDKYSGAENVACELINNTDGAVYDSYYCSPSGEINKSLQLKNINHIDISGPTYSEIKRIIKKYKPDIVYAHDFKASIIASLFRKKVKVISHIHQNPQWFNKYNLKSITYKLRLNSFGKVVVVTDVMRSSIVFNKLLNNKLVTLHNFIDIENIKKQGKVKHNKKYDITFCGRFEDVKRPMDFIEIVSEICKTEPNIKAVMIGSGSLMQQCRDLISEKGLWFNIELVGFQTNPYKFIKNSNFLMMTSEAEGFGLVVAEAMLLNTFVLAYDVPGVKEVVGSDPEIICKSMSEIQAKFLKYYSSKELFNKKVKLNYRYINNFLNDKKSWQTEVNNLYKINEIQI